MIHERDRQTDGQTDSQTPHADIGRAPLMHCIARQKLKKNELNRPIIIKLPRLRLISTFNQTRTFYNMGHDV